MSGITPAMLDAMERPVRRERFGKAVPGGPNERAIQRSIIAALRKIGIRCIHIPNGGSLTGSEYQRQRQGIARRMDGVVTGFPDLLLIRPGKPAQYGLLEVKRPGGTASIAQSTCIATMRADGCCVEVVTSLDQALDALRKWGWL